MKNKIEELEKRIVVLEGQVQAQPTLEEIVSEISNRLMKSLTEIRKVQEVPVQGQVDIKNKLKGIEVLLITSSSLVHKVIETIND
ncbi:hypothetical protein KQI36_14340 [Clostridium senegalense]|uniref:hypothetical protein n=1 Tax=Clostridium senegalense TaxID=1465809 RepID=UPI001C11DB14|nr:hypothetical protein [Clostridium senegalense]MBU5227812.1 hypothetical protein [Clostridium senegalense]